MTDWNNCIQNGWPWKTKILKSKVQEHWKANTQYSVTLYITGYEYKHKMTNSKLQFKV
jgi:hypothetical protein